MSLSLSYDSIYSSEVEFMKKKCTTYFVNIIVSNHKPNELLSDASTFGSFYDFRLSISNVRM